MLDGFSARPGGGWCRHCVLALLGVLLLLGFSTSAWARPVRLWHAYRGEEQRALEEVIATTRVGAVDVLAIPSDAYAAKLAAAIPLGEGPDLFIDAHERLGDYVRQDLVGELAFDPTAYVPAAVSGVTIDGRTYGLPLSRKCVALYVNRALVARSPEWLEDLAPNLRQPLPPGHVLLAYENISAYYHAPWLAAFGGRFLQNGDSFGFVGEAAERSLLLAKSWLDQGWVLGHADGALVTQFFRAGRAAYAISGPWLAGDLHAEGVPYDVVPLPKLRATGLVMRPLLTIEAVMASPNGARSSAALALALELAGADAARVRMVRAHVVSARSDVVPLDDPQLQGFQAAADLAEPMPTSAAMRAVWEPSEKALRKVLNGTAEVRPALLEAERRFRDVRRPGPPPASRTGLLMVVGMILVFAAFSLVKRAREPEFRARLRASVPAYRYLAHAVCALGVLVFAPLCAGAVIAFTSGRPGASEYVGVANFREILSARGGPLFASGSFYFVLAVTVAWTLLNVAFHLGIGLTLGVLLSRPLLRLKAVYRVLLILPWAVPSYVTALAWKGMFHRQFGALTALFLQAKHWGIDVEPIDWFARFSTAFTANLATNVWLGFPFMMVVTISAVTSLPSEVLEAAEVDGATRWQRFTKIILPLLRPSMVPAVALGAVWTFNMFNVVFLVSGGEPDGETDVLVSEAYRWAFTRQAQYGYAAAYSVLIFALLFASTRLAARLTGKVVA